MRVLLLTAGFFTVSLCCKLKDFLPCVMQLSSQKVDFNMNPVEVIFNITTEAKLMHTCRTYGRIFPCFDQKMVQCGTADQRAQLVSGKRLHSFLCAPFALQRQKVFLRRSKCIQEVLAEPPTKQCNRNGTLFEEKLQSCREMCKKNDCAAKIELSEISTCTFLKIENKCTAEAAEFFGQMQQVLTNKEYPMQCQYNIRPKTSSHELKKGLPLESLAPTPTASSTSYVTIYPPSQPPVVDGIITKTSMPIMRRTDPNSKAKARPTAPIIKTVLVDEKGMPITTSTKAPRHKFLPNPYTTKNPNNLMQNDIVRTTRTVVSTNAKHNYIPWNYKADSVLSTVPSVIPAVMRPSETVLSSPPMSFDFKLPPDQTSTQPFKVEINWMDDSNSEVSTKASVAYVSPWYIKSTPSLRPPEEQVYDITPASPMEVVNPFINQLKSQSLNFTEIGNQANNYFSAALSAFTEKKNEMAQNDPWRTFIDAVAPTIQKVSPDIIPRIREEINRIQPQKKI